MSHPDYWAEFVAQHALVGREVSIPESCDQSGLGGVLRVCTTEETRDEAEEAYPGIAVASDGFIPIGLCMLGSGDPYFINRKDGVGGPLYRIYHDAVANEPYDPNEAITVVLQDYRELLSLLD